MTGDARGPMALVTTLDRPGGIRVITLDNPPANALSFALAAQLVPILAAAESDPAVQAIVVRGARGTFSAGADIADFNRELTPRTRTVRDVVAAVERSAKTVVAAIEGHALGGAFELALACDYRIAAAAAKVGLPEIKLGLLPGAGGTQRLPRLIGAKAALEFMLKGESVGAADACARGLLDDIATGDVVDAAVALVERVQATAPKRRLSQRPAFLGVSGVALFATPFVVAQAHTSVPSESNGGFAAHKLIDAVEAALELDFARGLAREARLFDELLQSSASAALRHVFFAERDVGKLPLPSAQAPRPIARAGVIGAGTMGSGIAIAFAAAGIPVTIVEPSDAQVERSKALVFGMFSHQVQRGRLTQQDAWERARSIAWEAGYARLADVDIVVEAVFERMDVKQAVFAALDDVCGPATIFATNTSTLDVDELAAATRRPDRCLGLHFFAPADIMKLLEIVRGRATSAQTLATALKLAKTLRKVGVVSANAFGFIGNRMFFDYAREAIALLETGIAPERIDRVMTQTFGFAMGPFATFDLSGIDVFWHIMQARPAALGEARTDIIDRLYAAGRWGQKTGSGFYRYDPANKREPLPDPALAAFVAAAAARGGRAPREVADDEIVQRLVFALVNAGAELLDRAIASRPGDIDTVWIYGYGFPPHRGGPMWYADEVGLRGVVDAIRGFGWPVAGLLDRLAAADARLADHRELTHA
jgi:3-hydroxyacyl-CoA dehydrogenase